MTIDSKTFTHVSSVSERFKKPLTTLNLLTSLECLSRCSPIACAVSSGFLLEIFVRGKHTTVCDPSNSGLVGWICGSAVSPNTSAMANPVAACKDLSKLETSILQKCKNRKERKVPQRTKDCLPPS